MVNILVCVKRVPMPGARITVSEDEQLINTRLLSFAVGPHEECAVEEAIRQVEQHGGRSMVLTLGPSDAEEQLRSALAMGIDEALLVETDIPDWPPIPTSEALIKTIQTHINEFGPFDVVLFGNESADSGGYQVGIRVSYALGMPCVAGIKGLEIQGTKAIAKREAFGGGWEIFEVDLPAVFMVKEGINLPRYPSLRGKLQAKKKEITRISQEPGAAGLKKVRLRTPEVEEKGPEILGESVEAAPKVVKLLKELGLVQS